MFQVDKIIEATKGVQNEIAELEKEIAELKQRLEEREKILPGLIQAQNLLLTNLPQKEDPKIIKYRERTLKATN